MVARNAVRLALVGVPEGSNIGVGVSGGADSLALLVALSTIFKGKSASLVHVVSVDHQLQAVTATVSLTVARLAEKFGFNAHIVPVDIPVTGGGAEADARTARYGAFEDTIRKYDLKRFLIGHTRSDQAEQVMLGLLRGSGTRSLSGMPVNRGVFVRPFLNFLSREDTQQVCVENDVEFWCDPHNDSSEYNRVNVRKLIKDTEKVTGQQIVSSLVRSAQISVEDADALDFYADATFEVIEISGWSVATLEKVPMAVRKRLYRSKLVSMGVDAGKANFDALTGVDGLITNWHGQKVNNIVSNLLITRQNGRIVFEELNK